MHFVLSVVFGSHPSETTMAQSNNLDFFELCSDLQTIDSCTFRASSKHMGGFHRRTRLFGGQIVAQALQAAIRTAPLSTPLHIHVRFVRPGSVDAPVRYEIDKEHLSVNLRCVEVKQDGRIIATCRVVFGTGNRYHNLSSGHPSMKRALTEMPPNTLLNLEQLIERYTKNESLSDSSKKAIIERLRSDIGPFEFRPTDPDQFALFQRTRPTLSVWARWRYLLSDDTPPLFIALLLTDYAMIHVARIELLASGRTFGTAASLCHSVWLHSDDFHADGWLLLRIECNALADDRGLVRATMFTEAGCVVVTAVQECLMRAKI
uniref:Acyl-CoA thioesterase 8 n=1 Tax=Plectus sambesii TaxID=2011161 RepID=A0A914WKZ6_9BILA